MPFSSVEYSILQDLVILGKLAGTIVADGDHLIRELPVVGEDIDVLVKQEDETWLHKPVIIYTPHGPVESSPMSFEGDADRIYTEEICCVFGREGNFESHMQEAQTVHEQILRIMEKDPLTGQFRTSLPNVTSMRSIEIVTAPNFDRSKLNNNYAYLSVVVRLRSVE